MDYSIIGQPLRLGFGAFLLAAISAAVGFAGQSSDVRWLAIVALCVVAIAVACGFFAIGWGWYHLAFARKSRSRNAI